ncbi:MAG: hypothetical protein ACTJFR_04420 [Canibacter sp.]
MNTPDQLTAHIRNLAIDEADEPINEIALDKRLEITVPSLAETYGLKNLITVSTHGKHAAIELHRADGGRVPIGNYEDQVHRFQSVMLKAAKDSLDYAIEE